MVDHTSNKVTKNLHLNALDGFRASLALWVYFGHLAAAVGFQNYVLDRHPLAVDLFMVLSGFLMVHTWKESSTNYRFLSIKTLSFYGNRFFRIAPLYYFLLLICYLWAPSLAKMHDATLSLMPPAWAQGVDGYSPHTSWNFESFKWIASHLTILFGLVPGMENSTPLPDWSLSLEMQFYLILPLLLLSLKKIPLFLLATLSALIALASPTLFGNYLDAGLITHFGQPSFLPYRLNAFIAGMIPAFFLQLSVQQQASRQKQAWLIAAALICISPLSKPVMIIYGLFVALVFNKVPRISWVLSTAPLRFLGKISYSIYLCHILIVIPITYGLIKNIRFLDISSVQRFMLGLLITLPIVIVFSYALYQLIEKRFINIWKSISINLK